MLRPLTKTGGRNNQGKITVAASWRRPQAPLSADRLPPQQGRHRRRRSIRSSTIRTARAAIALLHYVDGEKRYILAPEGLKEGDTVLSGQDAPATVGNCLPLSQIPLGMDVHNIEMQPGRGGVLCRSAGTTRPWWPATPTGRRSILPSGEIRRVPAACRATIGTIGNGDHMGIVLGKAGRKRWLGRRPHVRGTAMNPIDHPHGGGEGRTKGGRHPVSPTGKLAKGGSTRKRRKPSNKAIVRRRKSRRYGVQKVTHEVRVASRQSSVFSYQILKTDD